MALRAVALLLAYAIFYAWVPVHGHSGWGVAAIGVFVLGIFTVNLIWELRRIARSKYPMTQGAIAVGSVAIISVLTWSLVFLSLSDGSPDAFNEPLDKVSAFYFSVTVLGTVGFGDIHAVSNTAMLLVSTQILVNVLLVTASLRLVFTAGQKVASARFAGTLPEPKQRHHSHEGHRNHRHESHDGGHETDASQHASQHDSPAAQADEGSG